MQDQEKAQAEAAAEAKAAAEAEAVHAPRCKKNSKNEQKWNQIQAKTCKMEQK